MFCWKSVWENAVPDWPTVIVPFQSLFCWKSVWEFLRNYRSSFLSFVSILVLLEIGLGASLLPFKPSRNFSFNPCFVGNRSGRELGLEKEEGFLEFQSLFCWKSVWEFASVCLSICANEFQSLFCWKSVWEETTEWIEEESWKFQSLFCWKSVWEHDDPAVPHREHQFQSLFCWKSVWELQFVETITVQFLSFNPCFVGNRSGRS